MQGTRHQTVYSAQGPATYLCRLQQTVCLHSAHKRYMRAYAKTHTDWSSTGSFFDFDLCLLFLFFVFFFLVFRVPSFRFRFSNKTKNSLFLFCAFMALISKKSAYFFEKITKNINIITSIGRHIYWKSNFWKNKISLLDFLANFVSGISVVFL